MVNARATLRFLSEIPGASRKLGLSKSNKKSTTWSRQNSVGGELPFA